MYEWTYNAHSTAREGSKARKIPGWAVIFTIPVTPRSNNQTNVTKPRVKNAFRVRFQLLTRSKCNTQPSRAEGLREEKWDKKSLHNPRLREAGA